MRALGKTSAVHINLFIVFYNDEDMNYGIRSLPFVKQKKYPKHWHKILLGKFNLLLITLHNKCKTRLNRLLAITRHDSIELKAVRDNSNFLKFGFNNYYFSYVIIQYQLWVCR